MEIVLFEIAVNAQIMYTTKKKRLVPIFEVIIPVKINSTKNKIQSTVEAGIASTFSKASTTVIGDFLHDKGEKFVLTVSALSCLCTVLIFHKTIASSISLCLASTKSLNSKPPIVKAITQIGLVFFWHWLVIVFFNPWDILKNLIEVSVDVQMCFIFFLLEGAVRGLNKSIKEHYDLIMLKIYPRIEDDHPMYMDEYCLKATKPTESTCKLRHIHSLLYGTMQATNKCYGIPAFFIALFCRFLFTLYLYRWLKRDYVIEELLGAWISFQRILYICYRLESLKLEETRVFELLNNLDLSPLDSRTKIEFELFLVQMKDYPLTFTSVELFTLDFSLITSMFMTTMTYLLLLSQL